MKKNYLNKGFTLIELLVVIAIIGILATVVIASLSQARIRAKDAAVKQVVSSFRSEAELEFGGQFFGICTSDSYNELVSYVNSQGGEMRCDIEMSQEYRIIATLPSGVTNEEGGGEEEFGFLSTDIAYAASGDALCINSFGEAVNINLISGTLPAFPRCTSDSAGGYSNYRILCPTPPSSTFVCLADTAEGDTIQFPTTQPCTDAGAEQPACL